METEVFNDPVLRCMTCGQLVLRVTLHKEGCCPRCGHRRVQQVMQLEVKEMEELREAKISEEFLILFEEVENAGLLR